MQHRRNVLRQRREPWVRYENGAAWLILLDPMEPSLKVLGAGVGLAGALEESIWTHVVELLRAGRGHQRADLRGLSRVVFPVSAECRGEPVRDVVPIILRYAAPQVRHVHIQSGDLRAVGGEPFLMHRVSAKLLPDAACQRDS